MFVGIYTTLQIMPVNVKYDIVILNALVLIGLLYLITPVMGDHNEFTNNHDH
jgi:hypothetical protein